MREVTSKAHWRRVKFGEIAENIQERVDDPSSAGVERYVGLEHLDPGSLKIRRWGTPSDVEATKLRFQAGDIIFGRRRAYQRKLAVADFEGICSAHALVLRERRGTMVAGLLPYFMQSDAFMERAVAISVGSLSPTINWTALREQEFALPPIQDQQRYLALLASAETLKEALRDAENETRTLLSSIRETHFSIAKSQKAYPANTIAAVSLVVTKGESPGWQGFGYVDGGTRFITSENVLDGVLSLDPEKFVPVEFGQKLERSRLLPGDLLINIVGGSIGRMCIVPDAIGDANVNQAVAVVRPNPSIIRSEYLLSCLLSRTMNHALTAKSVDDYKPNLSLSSIRQFVIPVPPLSVQAAHLEHVTSVEQSLTQIHRRGQTAVLQKWGLMREWAGQ